MNYKTKLNKKKIYVFFHKYKLILYCLTTTCITSCQNYKTIQWTKIILVYCMYINGEIIFFPPNIAVQLTFLYIGPCKVIALNLHFWYQFFAFLLIVFSKVILFLQLSRQRQFRSLLPLKAIAKCFSILFAITFKRGDILKEQ